MKKERNTAIGIDIGGTKIEGSLVDRKGQRKETIIISTPHRKKDAIKSIIFVINELIHRYKRKKNTLRKKDTENICGIGIGIPGFADDNGKIIFSPNAPLRGVNLKSVLRKRFSIPVFIDNDANCFALAENLFGAGKGSRCMLGVILGTGIGCGMIIDNKVIRGAHGSAGEIGHFLFDNDADRIIVGKNDFESVCSGPNLVKQYLIRGGLNKDMDAKGIFESDEYAAKKVVDSAYGKIGVLLGLVSTIMDPDCIVLGGGLSKSLMPARLKIEIKKFSVPSTTGKVKLKRNSLGASAGVIGAAALCFRSDIN